MVVFGVAFCAIFAFDALAVAAPSGDTMIDSAGDQPGDWKLDFKNDHGRFHNVQFVRLLRSRDARGELKYDVIQMTNDPHYPFGLWDTYVGKCDSHMAADIWMGEINSEGEAKGLPSAKIEFGPQSGGPETLAKLCSGAAMEIVQDPVSYGRDFLKR